jgi:hypothetical protein
MASLRTTPATSKMKIKHDSGYTGPYMTEDAVVIADGLHVCHRCAARDVDTLQPVVMFDNSAGEYAPICLCIGCLGTLIDKQPNTYEVEIYCESNTPQISTVQVFAWSAEDAVYQVTHNLCSKSTSWDRLRKAWLPDSRVYSVRPAVSKVAP